MLDHYVIGDAKRISPEAPVPVILKSREDFFLGGAGNVFLNIKSIGGNADLFSVVGFDESGSLILNLMSSLENNKSGKLGSSGSLIVTDPSRKTTTKTRVIAANQQVVRIDEETTEDINSKIESSFIESFNSSIEFYDAVLIQDYNKGFLTPHFISSIIKKCQELKKPIIVDPKKDNLDFYRGATVIKPNFSEFCDIVGKKLDIQNIEEIDFYSKEIRKKLEIDILIVTMSERGIYFSSENESFFSEGIPVNVSDVSGAGDTVISVFSSMYVCNILDHKTIIDICNVAASIACSNRGTFTITPEDLFSHPRIKEKYLGDQKIIKNILY